MENKYKKISEWLSFYPMLSGWLYFNVTNIEEGNTSLNSVPGERVLMQYLDGAAEKELYFAIDMVKMYDTGTSNNNLDAINEVMNLSEWCLEQSKNGNKPDFTDCVVNAVEILESAPSASVDNDAGLIKYQIQGKVSYLEF